MAQRFECVRPENDPVRQGIIFFLLELLGGYIGSPGRTCRGVQMTGCARVDNCRIPRHRHATRIWENRHTVGSLSVRERESRGLKNRDHACLREVLLKADLINLKLKQF